MGAFELLHAWAISLNYYCDFFGGFAFEKERLYSTVLFHQFIPVFFFMQILSSIIFDLSSGFMLLKSQSYYSYGDRFKIHTDSAYFPLWYIKKH